jgi:saccharopine dehydrogenase-like NADP-dependent oxidoreductase
MKRANSFSATPNTKEKRFESWEGNFMARDTVAFFGLGAVGSVMLTCMAELAERDGASIRFVVFVRNLEFARDALFHAERLFERIEFVGLPEFDPIWELAPPYKKLLESAQVLVNAAAPNLNERLLRLAEAVGAHAVDLASDMYDEETQHSLTFAQYKHDEALRAKGISALINLGISPGVTNFLVGGRINEIRAQERKHLTIERVDLYLLEDMDSDEIVFSWSPLVALEELAQRPRVIEHGRLLVLEPFSSPRIYHFPHEQRPTRQYPLYQEELLSFHRAFPEIAGIGVWTGGAEVELVKSLFKLNLLSKRSIDARPGITVESVVRAILPGMNRPRRIEEYLRTGVIRRAHFAAAAEIRISEQVRNDRQTLIETVGLSYHRYRGLLDTPYAGATYISYPTGVGAAILVWHAMEHARQHDGAVVGVLSGEELARVLPRHRVDAIRRDLVAWDIELFDSVRDASSSLIDAPRFP